MCINVQNLIEEMEKVLKKRENANIKIKVERKTGDEKDSGD